MKTFEMDLKSLQPSQLYICSAKLAKVERSVSRGNAWILDPLPVRRLASRIVLTDGHTRACAAFSQGRTSVPAYWDTDELDWEAYQICVQWCLEEGVHSVADLATRVVPEPEYETLWLGRCRAMHERLRIQRSGTEDTTEPSTPTE